MKVNLLIVITFLLLFSSCESGVEHIVNNYYLVSFEEGDDKTLSYKVTDGLYKDIIGPSIVNITHDNDFIIVQQNPRVFPDEPNREKSNYYIIPLKKQMIKKGMPEDNYYVPYSFLELKKKCIELGGNDASIPTW